METVSYRAERAIPVVRDVDVVVAGGGPGGLGAAVFAARAGARVVLMERYGAMGGMALHGEVHPFMPSHVDGHPLDGPVYGEWLARMNAYLPPSAGVVPSGDARPEERMIVKEAAALAAEDLALEAGVDLLYHHTLTDVLTGGRRIRAAVAQTKGGPVALRARCFVDATGDGDLAFLAGNTCLYGNDDGQAQPMTLCFKLSGVRFPDGMSLSEAARVLTEGYRTAKASGEVDCPREDILIFPTHAPDVVHFNTTRIVGKRGVSGQDLSDAEIEGRRQLRQLLAWLRKASPWFREARIHSMGTHVGVRETRRVLGRVYATREWFASARKEPDAVARICYLIDIHSPTGEGTEREMLPHGDWYEIPYGCLVARDLDNLTVGCRAISADHALHSSLRIMPSVATLGQAAGLAAAWAARRGVPPGELDGRELHAALKRMGALHLPAAAASAKGQGDETSTGSKNRSRCL